MRNLYTKVAALPCAHLEMFTLKFSILCFAIQVNFLHPEPFLFLYYLSKLVFWGVLFFKIFLFSFSICWKVYILKIFIYIYASKSQTLCTCYTIMNYISYNSTDQELLTVLQVLPSPPLISFDKRFNIYFTTSDGFFIKWPIKLWQFATV